MDPTINYCMKCPYCSVPVGLVNDNILKEDTCVICYNEDTLYKISCDAGHKILCAECIAESIWRFGVPINNIKLYEPTINVFPKKGETSDEYIEFYNIYFEKIKPYYRNNHFYISYPDCYIDMNDSIKCMFYISSIEWYVNGIKEILIEFMNELIRIKLPILPQALAELNTIVEIMEISKIKELIDDFFPITICGMPTLLPKQREIFYHKLLKYEISN